MFGGQFVVVWDTPSRVMRKQELLHVHGLLAQVRRFRGERLDEEIDAPGYEKLQLRPNAVHVSKQRHETAVFALAAALSGSGEGPPSGGSTETTGKVEAD